MQSTLKVTSRDFTIPEWLQIEIRDKVSEAQTLTKDLIDCEVAIEAPVGHRQKGGPYTATN